MVDSELYHCLADDGRRVYAAGLHRATRSDARWHLYCFSDGNVNGVIAAMETVPESNIRVTWADAGWRIEFLGPTTYLVNAAGFHFDAHDMPAPYREQLGAEHLN